MGLESDHGLSGSKRDTPLSSSQLANRHHVESILILQRRNIHYVTLNNICKCTDETTDDQPLVFLLKKITNYVIDSIEENKISFISIECSSDIEQFSTSIDRDEQAVNVTCNDRYGGIKRGGGHRF